MKSKTTPARRSATKSWTDDRHDRRTRDDRGWHFLLILILWAKLIRNGVVSRSISRFWRSIYSCTFRLTPVSACVRRPLSGCGRSIRWISCSAFGALATSGARCSRAAAKSLRKTGAVLLGGHMELEASNAVARCEARSGSQNENEKKRISKKWISK